MNFVSLLRGIVRRFPDKEALVDRGRRFSFHEFWRHIGTLANVYRSLGVETGDRVLLVLPNGAEFLSFHFAALKIGAVSVPVNAAYRSWEVGKIVADCRPRLLISNDVWLGENGPAMKPRLSGICVLSVDRLKNSLEDRDDRVLSLPSGATASINYSYFGGGSSRGAVLTHGNHIYAATGYSRHQGFTASDRFLITLPMAHVYALSGCVNSGLIRGCTLVIIHRYTPKAIFSAIEEHGITVLSAVPVVFDYLSHFPQRDRYDRSSLRLCVTGGDYMPAAVQDQLEVALGAPIVQGYGLTECLPVICNPPSGLNKRGTLGIPGRKDIKLRIVGPTGDSLAPGEVGEIAVRSPTTMSGYFGKPRETAEILRGGWLYTGDWGWLDQDGYLHFSGLRKKILNVHGNKVDPLEVANCLLSHPGIADAEVTATPVTDGRSQQALEIRAEIKLKEGESATEEELRAFLRQRLAAYKVPTRIWLRTPSETVQTALPLPSEV